MKRSKRTCYEICGWDKKCINIYKYLGYLLPQIEYFFCVCLLGLLFRKSNLWGYENLLLVCCVLLFTQTPPSECDFRHTYAFLIPHLKLQLAHIKSLWACKHPISAPSTFKTEQVSGWASCFHMMNKLSTSQWVLRKKKKHFKNKQGVLWGPPHDHRLPKP